MFVKWSTLTVLRITHVIVPFISWSSTKTIHLHIFSLDENDQLDSMIYLSTVSVLLILILIHHSTLKEFFNAMQAHILIFIFIFIKITV